MRPRARVPLVSLVVTLVFAIAGQGQDYHFSHYAGTTGGAGVIDDTGSAARLAYPWSIARDASGTLYVADSRSGTIRAVTLAGVVSTLAGLEGAGDLVDGRGGAAHFSQPRGITADGSGNLYVTDGAYHVVRRIAPNGVVTTIAGAGHGSGPSLSYPTGIAFDPTSGNLYVADYQNHAVRRVTPAGVVTNFAGVEGSPGSENGPTPSPTRFNFPAGVAVDSAGNVYVSDQNHIIRKITPAGVATTFAGTVGVAGYDNTPGSVKFNRPEGMAVDAAGNVYVADTSNARIRKITAAGSVSSLAGGTGYGHVDGPAATAQFAAPTGVTVDGSGTVFVVERENHAVRQITSGGVVSTIAGAGAQRGQVNGNIAVSRFFGPDGLTFDTSGNLFAVDRHNSAIRKITTAGDVTSFAGGVFAGSEDNTGTAARFRFPSGIGIDASNNLYVADQTNHTIRKITPAAVVTTLAGLAGSSGTTNATGSAARFNQPTGIAVDGSSNVYVADWQNHAIRKITPAGVVTTFAGLAGSFGAVNSTGTAARFSSPIDIVRIPSTNDFYVADAGNYAIRKITSAGVVTTFAGQMGAPGNVDATGADARFVELRAMAINSSGTLFVADRARIRKITPAGVVTTIGGVEGVIGREDGSGEFARFSQPGGLAVNPAGRLFVSDIDTNSIIRGEPALEVSATIDSPTGPVFVPRTLGSTPAALLTNFSWRIVRRPTGSTATISNPSTQSPSFTPDVPDVFVFRLTATYPGSIISITDVMLTATCPTITIGPVSLPHPFAGVAYSQTISAAGGGGGYSFTSPSGTMPPGLTLAADGTLSGTSSTPGTYTFTVRATDSVGCTGERSYTLTVGTLTAPTGLIATWSGLGSGSPVNLTWNPVSGAAGYRIYRTAWGSPWAPVGTSGTTAFSEVPPNDNIAFIYKVRAYDGAMIESADSNLDFANTYGDLTAVAGSTVIEAWHVYSLRTIITHMGYISGRPGFSYTDPNPPGIPVKAIHMDQMRAELNACRAAAGLGTLTFTDPSLTGVVIKAVHINELFSGVR